MAKDKNNYFDKNCKTVDDGDDNDDDDDRVDDCVMQMTSKTTTTTTTTTEVFLSRAYKPLPQPPQKVTVEQQSVTDIHCMDFVKLPSLTSAR